MKHKFASNAGNKLNKIFVAAFFSSALLFSSTRVIAQSNSAVFSSTEVVVAPEVVVEYIGNIDNQPVYVVKIDNIEKNFKWLSITNEHGDELYLENLKDERFMKKFRINVPEAIDTNLVLTVWGNKNSLKEVFLISSSFNATQKVEITKL